MVINDRFGGKGMISFLQERRDLWVWCGPLLDFTHLLGFLFVKTFEIYPLGVIFLD